MVRDRRRASIHEEFLLLAAAAVDGRIDADSAAALEAHLATCDACRADQAALLADHEWLAHPAAATWPKAEVREFILDAARAPRIPRTSDRRLSPAPLLAAAVVVVLVGIVGLGFVGRGPSAGSISPVGGSGVLPSSSAGATPSPSPAALSREVPAGPCAPRIADLSAWWPGESDGHDLVTGRLATLHGGARSVPGLVGSAFDFDGTSGYAEVTKDSGLELGTSDFTIMVWVRFDDTTGERVVAEQWIEGDDTRKAAGWTLTKLVDNVLLFTSEAANAGQGASTEVLGFEPGVWYHVAVRREGRDIALFVNDAGVWDVVNDGVIDIRANTPLLLGRRGDNRGFLLDGGIDELKLVVGRALFDSDIRADYLAGSTGTCPA